MSEPTTITEQTQSATPTGWARFRRHAAAVLVFIINGIIGSIEGLAKGLVVLAAAIIVVHAVADHQRHNESICSLTAEQPAAPGVSSMRGGTTPPAAWATRGGDSDDDVIYEDPDVLILEDGTMVITLPAGTIQDACR